MIGDELSNIVDEPVVAHCGKKGNRRSARRSNGGKRGGRTPHIVELVVLAHIRDGKDLVLRLGRSERGFRRERHDRRRTEKERRERGRKKGRRGRAVGVQKDRK